MVLITLLAGALSFLVYPHALLSSKNTLPDDNDTRLIAYIIGQVQDNLLHFRNPYFGRFFAPYENTLTYSDLFLTTAVITIPLRLISSSPVVIFNLAYSINFILTFVTFFILIRYLVADSFTALTGTLLFNLSGVHLAYLPHLQIFSLWTFFACLLFFLKRRYFFFFLILTLALAESVFAGYLIFFAVFIFTLGRPKDRKKLFFQLLVFFPLWLILLFPYLSLHFSFPEATRPIRDAAHFSLGLEEIFIKYHSWTLITLLILSNLESSAVSFAAIFCKVRRAWSPAKTGVYALQTRNFPRRGKLSVADKRIQSRFAYWNVIFLFSLLLSLGPVLKVLGQNLRIFGLPIPLPYSLFYYLFPGFNGFRTPSRFIILAAISAAVIISQKLAPWARKLLPQTKFFLTVSLIFLLFWESGFPLKTHPVNITPPAVYQHVKDLPDAAIILELPIKLWTYPDHEIESVRSLYSLEHKKRRINGFSGFSPKSWIDLVESINRFGLNAENRNRLHALGVTHVVEDNLLYPLP